MKGIKRSEETKKKVSERRKHTIATKGNPGLKSMQTEEAKEKVRVKNRIRNKENPPNKGRIWICKDGTRKMINPANFTEYEQAGWKKGDKN